MSSRPRTTKTADTTPAKKTTATRKTTAAASRPARKRATTRKTAGAPKLSLVKPRKDLPTRELPWMTDVQGYATLAARIVGIPTYRIRDWRDHRDGTATRALRDGSHLYYNLNTRTLTWQAVCRMGATHQYELTSHSMACAARLHADGCTTLHADLTQVPALTADELQALGLLQTPTWARHDLLGDDITATIPVPDEPLNRATASAADTQSMSLDEIGHHIAAQLAADNDQTKEHPQP